MGDTTTNGDVQGRSTLASRLRAARRRGFVGRMSELELFRSALDEDPPPFAVLYVHGPPGVGKSALLRRFQQEARDAGREPVVLDGRPIDPSPGGLLRELASVLGAEDADGVLDALGRREHPVLFIDTFEELRPVDGWLRRTFLPELPADALVVIAGRDRPAPGWRSDPGWRDLVRVVALRNLSPEQARELLSSRDVPEERQDEAVAVAHGHPLALVLVAEVLAQQPTDAPFSLTDAPDAIQLLLRRFLDNVPSDAHREALVACAHAAFATETMLREVVDGARAGELFQWLHELPFSEVLRDGVALHALVAEVLDADARWRDPDAYFALHRRLNRHLTGRAAETSGREQQRAMLHQLQLYRFSPVARRFFEFEDARDAWVEPSAPSDHDAIVEMTLEHEGEASADVARYWLDRQPEAFRVFRTAGSGDPDGFIAHLLLGDTPGGERDVDPVAAAAWEHIRATAPLRPDERVLLMRFWIDRETYQDVATHHLVSTAAALDWMSTPRLAWSLVALADPDFWEPIFSFIDFARADTEVEVGDASYGMFVRDWRTTSISDWLELLTERQLADTDGSRALPPMERTLQVLSREEFEDAVREALRGYARPGRFDDNPLLRSRVVVERADGRSPTEALEELLEEAADALADHPKDEKLRRALVRTYLEPAPTQEAAAERLGLPYSTFRRHLSDGVDHVTSWLWERELHGHR